MSLVFKFFYYYLCFSVFVYVHAGITVGVSCQVWVLGTELRSSAGVADTLNTMSLVLNYEPSFIFEWF